MTLTSTPLGTTVPPPAFAYESLDLVLQLATNGSTHSLHGAHVYTFEVPSGACSASLGGGVPHDKGCIVRELFGKYKSDDAPSSSLQHLQHPQAQVTDQTAVAAAAMPPALLGNCTCPTRGGSKRDLGESFVALPQLEGKMHRVDPKFAS